MIYLVSLTVFSSVILSLVALLILLETKIVQQGDVEIVINNDSDKSIKAPAGNTLLSALLTTGILLPSSCGGKATCGTCKCRVEKGGGEILPTELALINRNERLDNVRLSCQLKVKEDMKIRVSDEIFSIRKYHATVVSNKNVATFIKELVLKLDEGGELDFKAGAYIQVDIPEYEISYREFDMAEHFLESWQRFGFMEIKAASDEPVFRAYSLANPPAEKGILKFTIRIATPPPDKLHLPPGVGSSFIFGLKPGDQITLSGPYGNFFVKDTDREMRFIGGGAGMAPLRSHILHQLLTVKTRRKMTFWYGARSVREMIYDEEFKKLDLEFDNFSYHVSLSDPQPEDHGMV